MKRLIPSLGEKPKEDEAKEDKNDKDDKEKEESKSDGEEKKDDGKLMPPPSVIPAKPKAEAETSSSSSSKPEYRPLAGMLPEKYKDLDVKELFPEFRHNKVRMACSNSRRYYKEGRDQRTRFSTVHIALAG